MPTSIEILQQIRENDAAIAAAEQAEAERIAYERRFVTDAEAGRAKRSELLAQYIAAKKAEFLAENGPFAQPHVLLTHAVEATTTLYDWFRLDAFDDARPIVGVGDEGRASFVAIRPANGLGGADIWLKLGDVVVLGDLSLAVRRPPGR